MAPSVYKRIAGSDQEDMSRFLAKLTDNSVSSAASIPAHQLYDAFRAVEADLPDVTFRETPGGGFAVWTLPQSN